MDEEEEDEQQLINQVKPSKKSTVAVAPEESMEITGSGQGTVLGAPMQ
jgi:hypothetical protein